MYEIVSIISEPSLVGSFKGSVMVLLFSKLLRPNRNELIASETGGREREIDTGGNLVRIERSQ